MKHNQTPKGFTTVSHHGQPRATQYNSPAKLYSEENMKEALDTQAETLSQGVRG